MAHDTVDIEMQQHAITDRAIRVSKDGDDDAAVWLPLAHIDVEPKKRGVVLVTLPSWLALEKELI